MAHYYCKFCGTNAPSVTTLTSGSCTRHPLGSCKGKHVLYEGSEKSQYTCKNCGTKFSTITGLTSSTCTRHPSGTSNGKHEPAL